MKHAAVGNCNAVHNAQHLQAPAESGRALPAQNDTPAPHLVLIAAPALPPSHDMHAPLAIGAVHHGSAESKAGSNLDFQVQQAAPHPAASAPAALLPASLPLVAAQLLNGKALVPPRGAHPTPPTAAPSSDEPLCGTIAPAPSPASEVACNNAADTHAGSVKELNNDVRESPRHSTLCREALAVDGCIRDPEGTPETLQEQSGTPETDSETSHCEGDVVSSRPARNQAESHEVAASTDLRAPLSPPEVSPLVAQTGAASPLSVASLASHAAEVRHPQAENVAPTNALEATSYDEPLKAHCPGAEQVSVIAIAKGSQSVANDIRQLMTGLDAPKHNNQLLSGGADEQVVRELAAVSNSHLDVEVHEQSSSDRATPNLQAIMRPFGCAFSTCKSERAIRASPTPVLCITFKLHRIDQSMDHMLHADDR
jgi:hypothetical protein